MWLLIPANKWCATVCMSYRRLYCWFVVILTVNWFKSVVTQPLNPSDALGTRVIPGWVIDYFPPNETVYLSQERRIALIRACVTRVQRRLLAASIDDILISVQVLLQSYKSGLKTWACFQRRVIQIFLLISTSDWCWWSMMDLFIPFFATQSSLLTYNNTSPTSSRWL